MAQRCISTSNHKNFVVLVFFLAFFFSQWNEIVQKLTVGGDELNTSYSWYNVVIEVQQIVLLVRGFCVCSRSADFDAVKYHFFCHCAIHETADRLCFCTARQNSFLRDNRIFSYQKMLNDTTLKKRSHWWKHFKKRR